MIGSNVALVDQVSIDTTVGSASGHPETESAGGHASEPEGGPASRTATVDFHAGAKPNEQIAGRYTLREKIGEGGMGEVWVAKQSEPVKRKVALKLIKEGMDSRAVLQRFEQERQALAMMDHPNIAKVFDAGLTPGGQPFFVMELVNGLPLNKFCDQLKLTPKERLELFVPICQAVQHAHQKGIVHRDLKPANILITMVDARPVPKVIDFGVAKATGGKLTDESLSTQFGAIVGTFEYMSPEQTGFTGQDIDTRADIYSLGVILYELLTGLRPFDAARLKKAALTEMIRIIREEEPSKPSTRLSTDASLPSLAAMRQTEPRKLMTLLRGELDWVIMKCLEKHRERRYETASALARDIERYVADLAVEARPPSAGYRFQKFVRRNKGRVIAAGLVLLALVVGIIGTSIGLVRAEYQRGVAIKARNAETARAEGERLAKLDADQKRRDAETNLGYAKKANKLLGSVFENLNPTQNYATVSELRDALKANLSRAIQDLEGTAIGDPLAVAEMQVTLGLSLDSLGASDQAIPLFLKARETRTNKLGPDHPDTLAALNNLALAYKAVGRLPEAIALFERVRDAAIAKLGPDHPNTLTTLNNLAETYRSAGKLPEAIALFERVRDGMIAKLGPDHPDTLTALNNLALAYQDVGKLPEAIALNERVRDARIAKLGPDHPDALTSLHNLATAYQAAGKLPESIALLERVRDAQIAKLGPDHPDTLITLGNLAAAYYTAGKLPEAIALFERVRDARIAKLGPDHPHTLTTLGNLATAYQAAGKLPEAIALFERVRDAQIAKLGPDHPDTLLTRGNLAAAYWRAKQLDKSVPLFEDVLKRQEAKLGRQHPNTQFTVANLGVNYKDAGRLKEAIPLLEEAHQAAKRFPTLRWVANELSDAYAKAGENSKLGDLRREQLAEARKTLPKDSPQLAGTLARFGSILLEQKKWTEAEPLLRECLAIRESQKPDEWLTFNTKSMLGGALLGEKKYAEGEPLLLSGYDGMKKQEDKIPPAGKIRLKEAVERLVQFYEATSKPDEAAKWRKELHARRDAERNPGIKP